MLAMTHAADASSKMQERFSGLKVERQIIISNDGTPIEMQTIGDTSLPACMLFNGIATDFRAWRFVIESFADRFSVVSWTHRGHAPSGRPVGGKKALSVAHHAQDARAVMHAAGLKKPKALGWSMGGQILLETLREHKDLYQNIILVSTVAGRVFDTATLGPWSSTAVPLFMKVMRRADGVAKKCITRAVRHRSALDVAIRLGLLHHGFSRNAFDEVFLPITEIDTPSFIDNLMHLQAHDAYEILADIETETLLLAPTNDVMTPIEATQKLHGALPKSKLVILAGGSHYVLLERPQKIVNEIQRFWSA